MTGHKKAIRVNDQYHCAECGRQWDVDDTEPPPCKRESRAGREAVDRCVNYFVKTLYRVNSEV